MVGVMTAAIVAGIAVIVVGTIPTAIGFCIAQSRHPMRLQQAITEESKKYLSRSPIACSWKLETTRHFIREYQNNNTVQ
jgi:hypothetical protein